MPLDPTKPYPKRPRLRNRSSYIGERMYFITITTHHRTHYFVHPNIVASLVTYLRTATEQKQFDVLVYCYMPDHVHFLLLGTSQTSDLCDAISLYKQITAYNFTQTFRLPLWQASFHDHVLRKEETVHTIGRYILENPVRAGLVTSVLDYPFSGSFVYDLKELVDSDPFLDNDIDDGQA